MEQNIAICAQVTFLNQIDARSWALRTSSQKTTFCFALTFKLSGMMNLSPLPFNIAGSFHTPINFLSSFSPFGPSEMKSSGFEKLNGGHDTSIGYAPPTDTWKLCLLAGMCIPLPVLVCQLVTRYFAPDFSRLARARTPSFSVLCWIASRQMMRSGVMSMGMFTKSCCANSMFLHSLKCSMLRATSWGTMSYPTYLV